MADTQMLQKALTALALITACTFHARLQAQDLKLDGPLTFVVGYPPGGSSDRAARLVGDALNTRYGTTVIVENKPGAGGRLAAQTLKGNRTLMLGNPGVMVVAPLVFKDVTYDADTDFVPVAQVTSYEFGVAVGAELPVKDVAGLIDWLKAHPEKAFFGVPATGSLPHFFALMLGDRAQVKAEVVGYKGSAQLGTAVLGGEVPIAVDTIDALAPLHQGGRLRILATSGGQRSTFVTDVPTLNEAGIALDAAGWNAFFAPKSMPAAEIDTLAQAIQTVMTDPAVRKRFQDASMEPVSTSRAQLVDMLQAYKAQWQPVVKRSGYQP